MALSPRDSVKHIIDLITEDEAELWAQAMEAVSTEMQDDDDSPDIEGIEDKLNDLVREYVKLLKEKAGLNAMQIFTGLKALGKGTIIKVRTPEGKLLPIAPFNMAPAEAANNNMCQLVRGG